MRQLLAALFLSALAIAAMIGAIGPSGAADMPAGWHSGGARVAACGGPKEDVILSNIKGHPTVPGRTPYYTCITGKVLIPGDIPPPPEYCCG